MQRSCQINRTLSLTHISHSEKGGAAIAGLRLSAALKNEGVNSNFYTFINTENKLAKVKQRVGAKIDFELQKNFGNEFTTSRFRSWGTGSSLNEIVAQSASDKPIYHFHWTPGSIRSINLSSLYKSKVVFTLHDMHLFTSYCHYSLKCTNFKASCGRCPQAPAVLEGAIQAEFLIRERTLKNFNSIKVIAPSQWMAKQASESRILKDINIQVIPNVIPLPTLAAHQQIQVRAQQGLEDYFVIGVVGDKQSSKGSKESLEVCKAILARNPELQIKFQTFGELYTDLPDSAVLQVKEGSTQQEVMTGLSLCDIFLYCSPADNLPNLLLEAQSAGVLIVAANHGGVGETFENGVTGTLVRPEVIELVKAIEYFLYTHKISENQRNLARLFVKKKCDPAMIANKHINLYQSFD